MRKQVRTAPLARQLALSTERDTVGYVQFVIMGLLRLVLSTPMRTYLATCVISSVNMSVKYPTTLLGMRVCLKFLHAWRTRGQRSPIVMHAVHVGVVCGFGHVDRLIVPRVVGHNKHERTFTDGHIAGRAHGLGQASRISVEFSRCVSMACGRCRPSRVLSLRQS